MISPDQSPKSLSRRDFLKKLAVSGAGFAFGGSLSALDALVTPKVAEAAVASDTPIWPVSHTRQWLPFFEHVANRWDIYQFKSTFEPLNVWNFYDELEAREFGQRGHSREYIEYWENYLWSYSQRARDGEPEGHISREEESWGLCYEMKKIAALWPVPALGGREINGLQINERGLFHLLAAAGTKVAMTNLRMDQAGIQDRLAQLVDGRDRRSPVVSQPKAGQPGIWYRNVGGVTESLSDVYVDDFNLPPTYLSTGLIKEIFDPYLVHDINSVPGHLRGEVDASFARQSPFPVNAHLIYKVLYASSVI